MHVCTKKIVHYDDGSFLVTSPIPLTLTHSFLCCSIFLPQPCHISFIQLFLSILSLWLFIVFIYSNRTPLHSLHTSFQLFSLSFQKSNSLPQFLTPSITWVTARITPHALSFFQSPSSSLIKRSLSIHFHSSLQYVKVDRTILFPACFISCIHSFSYPFWCFPILLLSLLPIRCSFFFTFSFYIVLFLHRVGPIYLHSPDSYSFLTRYNFQQSVLLYYFSSPIITLRFLAINFNFLKMRDM